MKKLSFIVLSIFSISILSSNSVYAKDSEVTKEEVKSEAKELSNDTKRAMRKSSRAVQDKTCAMVNGKMECAAKKAKHTMQNAGDKVQDAID